MRRMATINLLPKRDFTINFQLEDLETGLRESIYISANEAIFFGDKISKKEYAELAVGDEEKIVIKPREDYARVAVYSRLGSLFASISWQDMDRFSEDLIELGNKMIELRKQSRGKK